MNVNGSKFHMLLGRDDWGHCTTAAGVLLEEWNDRDAQGGEVDDIDGKIPSWDGESQRLSLAQLAEILSATEDEVQLTAADRRAAASDLYGNIYALSADRRAITVSANGSRTASPFWPDTRYRPAKPDGIFAEAEVVLPQPLRYSALAITNEHFLVVATVLPAGHGLLRFDLMGGGEPEAFSLGANFANPVSDLVSDGVGGLWLLDATARRIFRLNRHMQFHRDAVAVEVADLFQPDGTVAPHSHIVAPDRLEVGFPPARVPLQLAAGRGTELFVLTVKGAGGNAIYVLDPGETDLRKIADEGSEWVMFAYSPEGPFAADRTETLACVPATGNQALAFAVVRDDDGRVSGLSKRPWLLPLRRFGGRGLIYRAPHLVYDSGPESESWIPLVRQKRRSYAATNRFASRVFDSGVPQCVWDRIRIDACIPPGTGVKIWARTADAESAFDTMDEQDWIEQPLPYLNRDGGELPGKRAIALPETDPEHATGCWDLLMQNVVGRFVQLRIELSGDGRNSPMLRALRIWYPRFSYSERFLPALYREEQGSADFLDRFLANMEGVNSVVEDKISTAQLLFDSRTASPEMLEWLSDWFDVMLDPSWNESRRRLFLRNAATFFGWRGTSAAMTLALRLAFDESLSDEDFRFGGPQCIGPGSIRIVENFSTARRAGRPPFLASVPVSGPGTISSAGDWTPSEGSAGLFARIGQPAIGRFPLFDDAGFPSDAAMVMQLAFGFAPAAGAQERAGWQAWQMAETGEIAFLDMPFDSVPSDVASLWSGYLSMRSKVREAWQAYLEKCHRRIARLNAIYRSNWSSFSEIPIPDHLPDNERAIVDWLLFEGQLLPRMAAAHRFSVLLPVRSVLAGNSKLESDMALAKRVVEIEKPAHTICDVRFYWAMNRVGEAQLGTDTELGASSRAPELIPPAIVGQAYLGSNFIGGPQGPIEQRERLAC